MPKGHGWSSSRAWSQLEPELSPAPGAWPQLLVVPGSAGWALPTPRSLLLCSPSSGQAAWTRDTGEAGLWVGGPLGQAVGGLHIQPRDSKTGTGWSVTKAGLTPPLPNSADPP